MVWALSMKENLSTDLAHEWGETFKLGNVEYIYIFERLMGKMNGTIWGLKKKEISKYINNSDSIFPPKRMTKSFSSFLFIYTLYIYIYFSKLVYWFENSTMFARR